MRNENRFGIKMLIFYDAFSIPNPQSEMGHRVTAPSEAEDTSLAYFAMTPVV